MLLRLPRGRHTLFFLPQLPSQAKATHITRHSSRKVLRYVMASNSTRYKEGEMMRRLVAPLWVVLLVAFVAVSAVPAAEEHQNPNIERLADKSAEVRAAAAKALGGG
jgi:hypothetical protein